MSGPARGPRPETALLCDPGVLSDQPVFACGALVTAGVAQVAWLPWRGAWLAARAAGIIAVETIATLDELHGRQFMQAVVHIVKGRAATQYFLAAAWSALAEHGRLLVVGGNDLGIATWGKRLSAELHQPATVLANRAHGRVLMFMRDQHPGPAWPETTRVASDDAARNPVLLSVRPGAFSGDGLDQGTRLLLDQIAAWADPLPPVRIVDVGCGAGHLAIAALRRWPDARALLLDADMRALASARENLNMLGLDQRGDAVWWDAHEPIPMERIAAGADGGDGADAATLTADLVLMNPPFHEGTDIGYAIAQAMFRSARAVLATHGHLLVVANRRLPYERDLLAMGTLRTLAECDGFKVMALTRG